MRIFLIVNMVLNLSSYFSSYEVHEKLQNFMVPVPVAGSWHDEQVDELFGSLLGKGFENALGAEYSRPDQGDMEEALQGGFRLFG